jgi:hypothetical protein
MEAYAMITAAAATHEKPGLLREAGLLSQL